MKEAVNNGWDAALINFNSMKPGHKKIILSLVLVGGSNQQCSYNIRIHHNAPPQKKQKKKTKTKQNKKTDSHLVFKILEDSAYKVLY